MLFVFVRDHLKNIGAKRTRAHKTIDDQLFAPFRPYGPGDPDDPCPRVHRILDRLRQQADGNGSRFAIFLVPAAPCQMSQDDFEMLLAWCGRTDTDCLNLLEVFEGKDHEDLFLPHDLHWTGKGHLLAAQTLSGFIAARGLLDPKTEPSWPSSTSTDSGR